MSFFAASSVAAQEVDNELWIDQNFSFTLSPRTALRLQHVNRFDENVSNFATSFLQVGVRFKVRSWLSLTPWFRHLRANPFDANSRFENRLLLDAGFATRRGRWHPNLRARFERRFIEAQKAFFRFRIRPGVQYKLPVRWQRRPALDFANELSYDTRADRLNRNRFRVGILLPATAKFSLRPYYMVESNRLPTRWDHDNIWGVSLYWNF
ncbi:MAG: DUF2490 domain-containing protein [Terriglobia bacterium]